MAIKNGGPAFPEGERWTTTDLAGAVSEHSKGPLRRGMSLRDYFAGQALAGWGEVHHEIATVLRGGPYYRATGMAEAAYEIADAMLAQRDKEQS